MRNILLPTDFSENSKNAIRFAMKFFEGEIITFHILNSQKPSVYITADVLSGSPGNSVYDGILNDNKKELEKMILYCESISEKENFTFVPKIDFDNIADAINQVVTLNNIDLIVMGTNGATGAREVVFGSNTLKTIRNVSCPIIAVPEAYAFKKIDSILLSISYQDNIASEDLGVLLEIIRKNNSSLKVLEIEENIDEIEPQKNDLKGLFKDMAIERFSIKNLPAPVAINAFEQLIPVQLHALFVERRSFLNRFIFGSDTSEISYGSRVPLIVLQN